MVAAAGTAEGMARRYSLPLAGRHRALPDRRHPDCARRAPLTCRRRSTASPEVLASDSRSLASPLRLHRAARRLARLAGAAQRSSSNTSRAAPTPPLEAVVRRRGAASQHLPRKPVRRSSPGPMVKSRQATPPVTVPGMLQVALDGNGRLLDFEAVPDDTLVTLADPVAARSRLSRRWSRSRPTSAKSIPPAPRRTPSTIAAPGADPIPSCPIPNSASISPGGRAGSPRPTSRTRG